MGQAKQRGTFDQCKVEAINARRIPAIRRKQQSEVRANRRAAIQVQLEFLRTLQEAMLKQTLTNR